MFLTGDEDPGLLGMPRAPEETHRSLEMMPAGDGALPAAPLGTAMEQNAMDQNLHQGLRTAITKYQKPGSLNHQNVLPQSSGD